MMIDPFIAQMSYDNLKEISELSQSNTSKKFTYNDTGTKRQLKQIKKRAM